MALSDDDRNNLVAFLDGELDEDAAQALAAKLANDPAARAEAAALQRTWEMLDYLPRTEASSTFTHRTLERLTVQTAALARPSRANPPKKKRRGVPRWLLPLGWAAAVLIAVGVGVLASGWLWPAIPPPVAATHDPAAIQEQLSRNLRVLENRRLYENVDDLEFLRALAHPDLFGDDEVGW